MLPLSVWNVENKREVNIRGIFHQFIFESLKKSSPMLGPSATLEGSKSRNPSLPVHEIELSTLRERFAR